MLHEIFEPLVKDANKMVKDLQEEIQIKIHSVCKTELEVEYSELGRSYHCWRCPKCDKIIPNPEIIFINSNLTKEIQNEKNM